MTSMADIKRVLDELIGQRCEAVDNPLGSLLRLDIGPMGHRADDGPEDEAHGWRHLTVFSPWRLEDHERVICDWNFPGGKNGVLRSLIQHLLGSTVQAATASPPGWDLTLTMSNGLKLFVFSDSQDEGDDAWMVLGTDGLTLGVNPETETSPE